MAHGISAPDVCKSRYLHRLFNRLTRRESASIISPPTPPTPPTPHAVVSAPAPPLVAPQMPLLRRSRAAARRGASGCTDRERDRGRADGARRHGGTAVGPSARAAAAHRARCIAARHHVHERRSPAAARGRSAADRDARAEAPSPQSCRTPRRLRRFRSRPRALPPPPAVAEAAAPASQRFSSLGFSSSSRVPRCFDARRVTAPRAPGRTTSVTGPGSRRLSRFVRALLRAIPAIPKEFFE